MMLIFMRARSIVWSTRDYSARRADFPTSSARRRGAREAVVDRLAQPGQRDRHYRDGGRPRGIERAQLREQIGRGLDEVAARGEVEHAGSLLSRRRQSW